MSVLGKQFHFEVWPNANPDKKFMPYPQREILAVWGVGEHRNLSMEGVHIKTAQALEWKGLIEEVQDRPGWFRLTPKGTKIAQKVREDYGNG